jgi:hypothetical protein
VKEKINDLIPWVTKVSMTLTEVNPDVDRDEAERRSQLAKSVFFLRYLLPEPDTSP